VNASEEDPDLANNSATACVVVSDKPRLKIQREGNKIVVSWPTWAIGFNLEPTASLLPSIDWTGRAGPPEILLEENRVQVDLSTAPQFYRLRKP
jgi:hypothetical protein